MSQRKKDQGRNRSQKRRKTAGKKQPKKPERDPVAFWGDSAALPTPESFTTEVADPLAMLHSLGPAPLSGVLAAPYFAAVYERAAGLASILSEAAGLDAVESVEPTGHSGENPNDDLRVPETGSSASARDDAGRS